MSSTSTTTEQSEFFAELARRLGLDPVPKGNDLLRLLATWLAAGWPRIDATQAQQNRDVAGRGRRCGRGPGRSSH
jgi:hypothetical protein